LSARNWSTQRMDHHAPVEHRQAFMDVDRSRRAVAWRRFA
jgi:hypothetical protein